MFVKSPISTKSLRATAPPPTTEVKGQFRHAGDSKALDLPPAFVRILPDKVVCMDEGEDGPHLADSKESPTGDFSLISQLGLMRGALGQRTYRFVMVANTTAGTTGAGVLNQAISISPSVVSYLEWPGLSALFDEVKLVRSEVHFRPQMGSNGQSLNTAASLGLIQSDVWCGADLDNISTAPSGFGAVIRLQGAMPIIRCIADRGADTMSLTSRSGLGWARTATPAVQDPPAGVLGSFQLGNANALSTSTTYYYVVLRTEVLLRNRF